jgi:Phage integrase family
MRSKALPRVLSRSPGAPTVRGDGGGENRSGDQPPAWTVLNCNWNRNPVMSCRRRVSGRGFADGIFFRAFVRQCQKAGPSGCALGGPFASARRTSSPRNSGQATPGVAPRTATSSRPAGRTDLPGHRHVADDQAHPRHNKPGQGLRAKDRLPHARLHDLRHLHATTLLLAGVPVHVVAARLGHSDPAITSASMLT